VEDVAHVARLDSVAVDGDANNVWCDVPDWGGIGARRLVRAESGRLGGSVWEIAPGGAQFVYHYHAGTEELLVVLRGSPTVQTREGERVLAEGDVLPFPSGPAGGHRFRNDGAEATRLLVVAAHAQPDVSVYPEIGKVATIVDGEHTFFRADDAVEHAGPED
jgi:uncharacterized cupin superfamily protein